MRMAKPPQPDAMKRAVRFFVVLALMGAVLGLIWPAVGMEQAEQPAPVNCPICFQGSGDPDNAVAVYSTPAEGAPGSGDRAIPEKSRLAGFIRLPLCACQPTVQPQQSGYLAERGYSGRVPVNGYGGMYVTGPFSDAGSGDLETLGQSFRSGLVRLPLCMCPQVVDQRTGRPENARQIFDDWLKKCMEKCLTEVNDSSIENCISYKCINT